MKIKKQEKIGEKRIETRSDTENSASKRPKNEDMLIEQKKNELDNLEKQLQQKIIERKMQKKRS